jgi:class 3 adenylate cyclase
MTEQRRLAAIVSADVAGYSRLMGRDESGTLAATTVVTKTIKLCTGAARRTITFNYRWIGRPAFASSNDSPTSR